MSGDVVVLTGATMTRLVSAIPVMGEQTGHPIVLIGGVAVMCRLREPYRVTTDLDTVDRRGADAPSQLELLLAAGGRPSGPTGALVLTPYGEVQVDVLGVTDADMHELPDDPTHRLEVLSHAWAAETASELTIEVPGLRPLTVRVAEPGPLVSMKLQSVMNRPSAKEGTDLLDIARIVLDLESGPVAFRQLGGADSRLRADALLHARRWFDQLAVQSLSKLRAVPEGGDMELDDVWLVRDVLVEALGS